MKTIYISKKRLEKDLEDFENDLENAPYFSFFEYISAAHMLRDFPKCKYYIYDYEREKFKPSHRK